MNSNDSNPYLRKFRQPRRKFTPEEVKTAIQVAGQAMDVEQEMIFTWTPKIGTKLSTLDSFILGADKDLIENTPAHAVLRAQATIIYIAEKLNFFRAYGT